MFRLVSGVPRRKAERFADKQAGVFDYVELN